MFTVLPRYEFRETGVGCAEHSDPACLCDVVVGTPVPIAASTVPFMFEDTVLDELGEYGANARNLYDVASVLLGLYETYVDVGGDVDDTDTAGNVVNPRMARAFTNAMFDTLDERSILAFRAHARAGSDWSVACQELPAGLSEQTRAAFRKEYLNRRKQARFDKRARIEKQAASTVATVVACEHCSKSIRNTYGRTRFCGSACKQAAYRARKVEK